MLYDGKRLGLLESGDGRCIEKGLPRGGVWGGDGGGIGPDSSPADLFWTLSSVIFSCVY